LQDTTAAEPAYYGWNNAPGFGDSYSLGVKTTNGYYVQDRAIRPWLYDPKFEEYGESKQYVPVLSGCEYKQAEDTVYVPLPCGDCKTKEIAKNRIYLMQDSIFGNKGFSVEDSDGIKKGWLVWAVSDKPLEEQSKQSLSLTIYRAELLFEPGKERYEIKEPVSNKSISGGFFVVPEFDEIGQIRFQLAGLLHKEDDHWQLVRPTSHLLKRELEKTPKSPKEDLTPTPNEGKKGLTPALPSTSQSPKREVGN
jgi:hypothetical protein